MTITTLISGLGSSGIFASRIFLPIFLVSLAFFADSKEWIKLASFGVDISPPTWFISEPFLFISGFIAFIEALAEENEHYQELTQSATPYVKSATSFIFVLLSLGVISWDQDAVELLKNTSEQIHAIPETEEIAPSSSSSLMSIPSVKVGFAALVASITFAVAWLRNKVVSGIANNELISQLGIYPWVARFEMATVITGVVIILLSPFLFTLVFFLSSLLLGLFYYRTQKQLEKMKVPCGCGAKILPIASTCPECGKSHNPTYSLSPVGRLVAKPPENEKSQQIHLHSWGRCTECGEQENKDCSICKKSLAEKMPTEAYVAHFDQKSRASYWKVALLSLLPFVGLALSAAYTRFFLLRPYQIHFGLFTKSWNKLWLKFLFAALVLIQTLLIPLFIIGPPAWLGYVIVSSFGPMFLYLSYKKYKKLYLNLVEEN